MEELIFTIGQADSGGRIDKRIALELGDGYSRTMVKTLIDDGFVLVNGKKVKPNYTAREGDEVNIEIPPPEPSDAEPEDIPLEILFEDEWVIVLNKPAGMVVHPGAGNRKGTLVSAVLFHCGKLPESEDAFRPGIVHRLDKDTSGVMVVAKNDRALRSLGKQFRNRTVNKQYAALVKGRVELDNGVIEAPLGRHPVDRRKMCVDPEKGRNARTVYHVVKRFEKFTFLRLELDTGRTHQIRVHLKHLGYPVLGDRTYGGPAVMSRQALHSEKLGFSHPDTGRRVEFTVPVPEDMMRVIERGEWDPPKG
ncbi:MAG: RluA family pseudouridine synthase [Candidatus Omnitrophica bacterium]|nr:RluA family pseudouridine synthase [Candidatus Omnitrophota bacterium]